MVEPAEIRAVAEAALDLGRTEPRLERLVGSGLAQEAGQRFIALAGRPDDRPIGDEPAQHRRLALGHDLALEALPIHRRHIQRSPAWPSASSAAAPSLGAGLVTDASDIRAAALASKAWPYEEARKL